MPSSKGLESPHSLSPDLDFTFNSVDGSENSDHILEKSSSSSVKREDATKKNDTKNYPQGLKLVLIFISLCTTTFLVAIDGTIIATVIPTITTEFNSLDQAAWYFSSYLLTTCGFQLPYGRAYTLLNLKWVYFSSIVIFMIGSLVCATAPSSIALIVGRAIAGIGGSGVFGGSFIIIAKSISLRKRSIYTGFIGGTFVIASVVGPVLGGAFASHATWRWCFYINLPIGAIALLIAVFFIPSSLGPSTINLKDQTYFQVFKRFDPLGTLMILPSITCLLLALQWGGIEYPWNSARVIATFTCFGILILIWIFLQYYQGDDATIPLSIVRQRSVAAATIYTFCGAAAFSICVYYLPTWFQAIKQVDAVQSGIHILPLVISLIISSVAAGGLVTVIGYYTPFLILGAILASIGAGLLMMLTPDLSTRTWIGFQILIGIGQGMSLELCQIACQIVLPESAIPSVISLNVFTRSLGGAISVSIAQNIFLQKLKHNLKSVVPDLDAGVIAGSSATDLIANVQMATGGDEGVVREVVGLYNGALVRVFLVAVGFSAVTFLAALVVEWKSVKKEKKEKAKGDEEKHGNRQQNE